MLDNLLGVIIVAIIVFILIALIVVGIWLFVFVKIIKTIKREENELWELRNHKKP